MTICIATPEYGPVSGGIATFYEHLSSIFSEAGHKIVILTVDTEKPTQPDLVEKKNNITVVTLRDSYERYYSAYKINASKDSQDVASALATGTAMREWLLNHQKVYAIDLIETVDVNGLGYFLIDPQLPAVVVCGHGTIFQLSEFDFTIFDKRYRTITTLEKKSLLSADSVITHSLLNQKALQDIFKIKVNFATAPWTGKCEIRQTNKKYEFIVLGRLQACKGAKVIAEALQKSKTSGNQINVTWIGNDTYTAPNGCRWSKYLQKRYPSIWQKNFTWMPAVPKTQAEEIISSACAVLIPSIWEAFGYSAVEALSLGKPVIISKGAGASYLFEKSNAAIIVTENDPNAFLEGIRYFPDLLNRNGFSESISYIINNRLSSSRAYEERITCYREALRNRARRAKFDQEDPLFYKETYNLRLPISHYINKFILKIKARL
jgi:glycosyltransferase involved in cell wall biosynthesis